MNRALVSSEPLSPGAQWPNGTGVNGGDEVSPLTDPLLQPHKLSLFIWWSNLIEHNIT